MTPTEEDPTQLAADGDDIVGPVIPDPLPSLEVPDDTPSD